MIINSSIFIIPRSSISWGGNEAGWITSSGWAAAGQELWGEALVATTDGVFSPQESRKFPIVGQNQMKAGSKFGAYRRYIPEILITAFKDVNLKRSKPSVWPIEDNSFFKGRKIMMVWERHDLFAGPGRRLADRLNVPFIISVEAPVVWEARRWGTKRPLWGKWLEKNFEAKSLKGADLVSCVSHEVGEKVMQMGIPQDKIIISPNRVDSTIFNPKVDGRSVALKYGLKGKRVIGWTGSFRKFHGLDSVLLAFKKVHQKFNDTILILVGDGQEFENTKRLAKEMDLVESVIFTGRQPLTEVPFFVANFHIGLVSAVSKKKFHYSPLKLKEYLACGRAVIAPSAGDLPLLFQDGKELLFYEAGNANDLADKMTLILNNQDLHAAMINRAIKWFEDKGTWIHELKIVCNRLNINY